MIVAPTSVLDLSSVLGSLAAPAVLSVVGMFLAIGVLAVLVVVLAIAGGVYAWRAGNRLQAGPSTAGTSTGRTSPNMRLAALDRLFTEVRAQVGTLDDPELIASLGKHLDELAAKKDAAADRLEELDDMLQSPMPQATRESKLAEQASLVESVDRIAAGLRDVKERLTRAPSPADVSAGISDALAGLKGELDAQERARAEIAALEKQNLR